MTKKKLSVSRKTFGGIEQRPTVVKEKDYNTKTIQVIPDQHFPFHHKSTFDFLAAVKKKYKPTMIVNLGDELDNHNISFHQTDPDVIGVQEELDEGIRCLKRLEKLFPEMILLNSNHGSLAVRKAKFNGIPTRYLASLNDVYGVSEKWKWVDDLTLTVNGQEIYFCHGMKKNGLMVAKQRGTCVVQGHFHTDFNIQYCGNPHNLLWSLQSGCLIDRKARAFAYDKLNLDRPILGCSIIINGQPKLIPMVLDKDGNWDGVVY